MSPMCSNYGKGMQAKLLTFGEITKTNRQSIHILHNHATRLIPLERCSLECRRTSA